MAATWDPNDVFQDIDHRIVTVVDRCGTGGPITLNDGRKLPGEFMYGGRVFLIKKEMALRGPVAIHVFARSTVTYVHDTEGNYVQRLGVKDDPDGVLDLFGPDVHICEPLDVDTTRIEHWDSETQDTSRANAKTKRVPVTQGMRGRDSQPGSRAGFAA